MDIDSYKIPERNTIPNVYAILRIVGSYPEALCYKRTARGWHLIIVFPRQCMEMAELVTLQAVLGSDPMREALNLMRTIQMRKYKLPAYWQSRSNILYDYKVK